MNSRQVVHITYLINIIYRLLIHFLLCTVKIPSFKYHTSHFMAKYVVTNTITKGVPVISLYTIYVVHTSLCTSVWGFSVYVQCALHISVNNGWKMCNMQTNIKISTIALQDEILAKKTEKNLFSSFLFQIDSDQI